MGNGNQAIHRHRQHGRLPAGRDHIPDAYLEAAIRSELNKPTDPITSDDMRSMTYFSAYGLGIVDLTGLEYATGLTDMSLGGNQIASLAPIAGLTGLAH